MKFRLASFFASCVETVTRVCSGTSRQQRRVEGISKRWDCENICLLQSSCSHLIYPSELEMSEVESFPLGEHALDIDDGLSQAEDYHDSVRGQHDLEQLAAQATARLQDALYAISQVIVTPNQLTPPRPTQPKLSSPFHPKTGQIRRPRDHESSDEEILRVESEDEEIPFSAFGGEEARERGSPKIVPKPITGKRGRPPANKSADDVPWVSTANGRYGINKPKCPPCARLKKKDPCNGQAPCRQCWGKGRRTPEQCQEWGENYVPKVRKRRARNTGVAKAD